MIFIATLRCYKLIEYGIASLCTSLILNFDVNEPKNKPIWIMESLLKFEYTQTVICLFVVIKFFVGSKSFI